MKMGTRVKWITASQVHGAGIIISEEFWQSVKDPAPHFLVSVDADPGEEHRVICCAATWLTEE